MLCVARCGGLSGERGDELGEGLACRITAAVVVFVVMLGGRWASGASLGDAFLCNALPARCLFDRRGRRLLLASLRGR